MTGRRSHGRLSALNGVVHQGTSSSVCPARVSVCDRLQKLSRSAQGADDSRFTRSYKYATPIWKASTPMRSS